MSQGDLTPERERLCRDFGRSLRSLVHDITNPLALVNAQAQLIEMKIAQYGLAPEERADLARRLRVIRDAVGKCEPLFSRYRAMYTPPNPVPRVVPLASLTRHLEGNARDQQAGNRLSTDSPPDVTIWVDPDATRLALSEVMCNAQQATHRGGRTSVGFVVADNTVSVSVVDDGVGMTSEVVARAFDPYFSGWESFETAGIGLCIAQAAVSSFGGSLHLASDGPGRGAECIMTLPLER